MEFKRDDFRSFSSESQRVVANLEQVYDAWADTRRQLEAMPVSLYWVEKGGVDYLAVKQTSRDNGTTVGRRSDATTRQFEEFTDEKNRLKLRLAGLATQLVERVGIYRRLRLPSLPDRQAEILRRLDIEGMLGSDLMVVGTNAFAAYELACGARFPVGNEETEDFDLAWCRDTKASLVATGRAVGSASKTLFSVLTSIDSSYRISARRPYQAVNDDGYEVELLAAPSVHPLPAAEAFDPMASLIEQEWLLLGAPLRHVVATLRGRACPLYVPDPRWMALHKLWLADKPERKASKREKDRRQGEVLLDATRFFLSNSHPIDVAFVLDLPEELRTHFDAWASTRAFVPA
jgi:hypothetical protein